MKKSFITPLLLSITFSAIFVSCTQNEEQTSASIPISQDYISYEEAMFEASKHLKLVDNSYYVLELTKEEAQEKGISYSDYMRMQQDVAVTNNKINELRLLNNPVELIDPQTIPTELLSTRTGKLEFGYDDPNKIPDEEELKHVQGRGILHNDSQHEFKIFIPYGVTKIHIVIYSQSILSNNTVALDTGFGQIASTTTHSLFGWGGRGVLIVNVNGVYAYLWVSVSSSLGGHFDYYFSYE